LKPLITTALLPFPDAGRVRAETDLFAHTAACSRPPALLPLGANDMTPRENPDDAALDSSLASLSEGFLVGGGRFTLVRTLGRGGMGVVWLARDEQLREDVALKFLPPEIRHDAVALDDLRRETARSRKLTHPNIIRIHDFYKAEHETFISMEFVDGPNLADLHVAQANRVFTWEYLQPIVKQLCEALDYAHGERIIHRDLKPANMMLDARGRLKLADFGIAAMVVDSASRVSMRHAQSGTSTYMSPQQMDGKLPQVSDDLYALGATLYELLTSRPPFFTGDIPHQVRHLPPQPIEERLAELEITNPVPPDVAALIMACLAKDPAQRPESARAVAEWIGVQPVTTTTTRATPPATTAPARAPRPPTVRVEPVREVPAEEPVLVSATTAFESAEEVSPEPAPARHRLLVPIVASVLGLVLVLSGAGVWWFMRHGERGPGADTETDEPVETVTETGSVGEQWILRGHSERVNAVAISRDGTIVASASADNTAILWDARKATMRVTLRAHAGDVNSIALSPDASVAVTGSDDHDVRLWDATTGVSTHTLTGHATNVLAVAMSPSGKFVASSDAAGMIIVWDAATGERLRTFSTKSGPTRCLAFRDDTVLASAGQEAAVKLWSVGKGKLWKTLSAFTSDVTAITFSPDGKVLATSCADGSRRHWEAMNFRMRWIFRGAKEGARTLSYSPDGTQFGIVTRSGALLLWETKSGKRSTKRIRIDQTITAAAFGDYEFAAAVGDTVLVAPYRYRSEVANDPFIRLFNGTDLTGWQGDPGVWSVVDHALRGTLRSSSDANHPSALVWNGGDVDDFELRFKFRLLKAGNSGVYFRASKLPNYEAGGYQFEIMRGNIGNLIEVGPDRSRRDVHRQWFGYNGGEEWHEGKITVIGSHIVHECDGRVLIDVNDNFAARPRQGVLALEAAGGPTTVEFRDLRFRRIVSSR
jgi:serine/threonine protein kinase/WD40 repeat protein